MGWSIWGSLQDIGLPGLGHSAAKTAGMPWDAALKTS